MRTCYQHADDVTKTFREGRVNDTTSVGIKTMPPFVVNNVSNESRLAHPPSPE